MVKDPRDTSLDVMPWTLVVQQDFDADKISFELTGIPYDGPEPAETFKATVIFQNPTNTSPTADIFEVTWQVSNGPVA